MNSKKRRHREKMARLKKKYAQQGGQYWTYGDPGICTHNAEYMCSRCGECYVHKHRYLGGSARDSIPNRFSCPDGTVKPAIMDLGQFKGWEAGDPVQVPQMTPDDESTENPGVPVDPERCQKSQRVSDTGADDV